MPAVTGGLLYISCLLNCLEDEHTSHVLYYKLIYSASTEQMFYKFKLYSVQQI